MCDTLGKILDGRAIFAKNSDRSPNEVQLLEYHPALEGLSGEVRCTYISIPQAERTNAVLLSRPEWMWGAEMGVNEHGLVIGNEAVFTLGAYGKSGLTGMDMVRLALERCSNAAEALKFLISLLETHGQGGNCGFDHDFYYDNAFLIMDRREILVLETCGRKWAWKRFEAANISNRLSLGADCDGWSGTPEHFSRRHTELVYSTFSGSRKRQALIRAKLPSIRTPEDAMAALRLHSHGGDPFCRGSVSSPCMHFGGLVGDHTTNSMVVELTEDQILVWATGCSCPCVSLFKPWVFGAEPALPVITPGDVQGKQYWLEAEAFRRSLIGKRLPQGFYEARDALEKRWLREMPLDAIQQERAFYERWDPEEAPSDEAFRRRWAKKDQALEK